MKNLKKLIFRQSNIYRNRITLIELILVLVVLCFLTGIVVTLFPDYRRKAKLVTNVENAKNLLVIGGINEIETCGSLPGRPDSLIDDATGDGGPVSTLLMNNARVSSELIFDVTAGGTSISQRMDNGTGNLTAIGTPNSLLDELTDNRGLTEVVDHITRIPAFPGVAGTGAAIIDNIQTPINATLSSGALRAVDLDTDTLLVVEGGLIEDLFNRTPQSTTTSTEVFIALGVGNEISILGPDASISHIPVYHPDVADASPVSIKQAYFRFILIYSLDHYIDELGQAKFQVKFIGVTRPNEQNDGGTTDSVAATGNDAFVSINVDHNKILNLESN